MIAVWNTFKEMAPYLLFGFIFAGALSVLIKPETVERHLGGRGMWQVVKASLLGVPLPLCSCSVIPVGASLRRHGAGSGATSSFLISTPQTGVDSIMVTLSLLGPVFAVIRPFVAFVSGIIGGGLVMRFGSEGEREREGAGTCSCECCDEANEKSGFVKALSYGFLTLPRDIGRALIVGVVLAGVISAIVPDNLFSGILGGGILSMLVMMAAGTPVYVCATASVPIAAALISKGVSPGAALVFLMTGPATNAATITTVWKMMGKRTTFLYLGAVAVTALAAGALLDAVYVAHDTSPLQGTGRMLPDAVKIAAAVVLAAVLAVGFLKKKEHEEKHTKGMIE